MACQTDFPGAPGSLTRPASGAMSKGDAIDQSDNRGTRVWQFFAHMQNPLLSLTGWETERSKVAPPANMPNFACNRANQQGGTHRRQNAPKLHPPTQFAPLPVQKLISAFANLKRRLIIPRGCA